MKIQSLVLLTSTQAWKILIYSMFLLLTVASYISFSRSLYISPSIREWEFLALSCLTVKYYLCMLSQACQKADTISKLSHQKKALAYLFLSEGTVQLILMFVVFNSKYLFALISSMFKRLCVEMGLLSDWSSGGEIRAWFSSKPLITCNTQIIMIHHDMNRAIEKKRDETFGQGCLTVNELL